MRLHSARTKAVFAFLIMTVASGCAHVRRDGVKDLTETSQDSARAAVLREPQILAPAAPGEPITVAGVQLKNTQFDIPVVLNSRVEYWINYFVGKGRPHFEKYLERSQLFVPYIQPILKANGMPEDLVYLAMIESGFNNHARSHAKAVGPWQFISATGKRYGLMVNWWVDERRDTRKSTLAAVGYLKDLYDMFRSWELAASAYNAGEAKVARAIRRYGTKDFWQISKNKFLRPETRDYYPKIIAAAIVSKNAEQFGFRFSPIGRHDDEAVSGEGEWVKVVREENTQPPPPPQTIAEIIESDKLSEQFEDGPTAEGLVPSALIPSETTETASAGSQNGSASSAAVVANLAKTVATPHVNKSGQLSGEQIVDFEIQGPADLLMIARAAGLSFQTVKALNPELLRWCTPPNVGGYMVHLPASVKDRFLSTYNSSGFSRRVEFMTHSVHSGDTMWTIARRYGIKVDPLVDLNGLSARTRLQKGMKVLLPLPSDRSRAVASLDVKDPPEKRRQHRRKKKSAEGVRTGKWTRPPSQVERYRVPASVRRLARAKRIER